MDQVKQVLAFGSLSSDAWFDLGLTIRLSGISVKKRTLSSLAELSSIKFGRVASGSQRCPGSKRWHAASKKKIDLFVDESVLLGRQTTMCLMKVLVFMQNYSNLGQ